MDKIDLPESPLPHLAPVFFWVFGFGLALAFGDATEADVRICTFAFSLNAQFCYAPLANGPRPPDRPPQFFRAQSSCHLFWFFFQFSFCFPLDSLAYAAYV